MTVVMSTFETESAAELPAVEPLHRPATAQPRTTTAGPPEPEAGAVLTVDLAAIEANWRALSRRTVPSECAAVIKGDAYGCGLEQVGRALARAGCKTFFVADLSEARRLRAVAYDPTIYVLNGVMPGTAAAFAEINARPVIASLAELAEWDAFVSAHAWQGGAALQVDTGMNRLGVTAEEAAAVAPRIRSENHGMTLLMSHLACAQLQDHPLNERQIKLFREIRMLYRGIPGSLANSSGIFLGQSAYCDLVRPGAALFGVNPTPGRNNPMRPVVELRAKVAQIRSVQRGETVGYDAQWTARRAGRLAIVPVGYADGYLRAASASDTVAGSEAIVAGKRCRLAGRISMDLLAIDIGELAESDVRRGDMVTLIGDEYTVDDLAATAGTIGYEVLTSLGRRYHRIYRAE
jgi:alanine racemase